MANRNDLPWLAPAVTIIGLVTALPFAWTGDFGWFLAAVFYGLPLDAAICAALVLWALLTKRSDRRRVALQSLGGMTAAVGLSLAVVPAIKDRIVFTVWRPLHWTLTSPPSAKDGVLVHWDSSGMAGDNFDSYLVFDSKDDIGNIDAAARWVKLRAPNCGVVTSSTVESGLTNVKRMDAKFYILTFLNCPLG